MNNDLISRENLKNAKPEFMNEKVVRDTKYQTTKDRIYAKAWNTCNSYWLNTINNAPTVEQECYITGAQWDEFMKEHKRPHGEWLFGSTLGHGWMKCSNCCVSQSGQTSCWSYCPNCGADMRKEAGE